jgi:hypothetical protein
MWRRVDLLWTDVSEEERVTSRLLATCSRWFLARGFFYPEDGGDTFLWNVDSHKIYTAPHRRRRHSSKVTAVKTSNPTSSVVLPGGGALTPHSLRLTSVANRLLKNSVILKEIWKTCTWTMVTKSLNRWPIYYGTESRYRTHWLMFSCWSLRFVTLGVQFPRFKILRNKIYVFKNGRAEIISVW